MGGGLLLLLLQGGSQHAGVEVLRLPERTVAEVGGAPGEVGPRPHEKDLLQGGTPGLAGVFSPPQGGTQGKTGAQR